jgi:pimeloyl-ACP methyl ester carboxylesterase
VTAALRPQWTTVSGLRMFARTGGPPAQENGTVVVLVQVRPQRQASSDPVLPELPDALRAWMDTIGLRRAALVGNSLGCQIAVELAVRRPETIPRHLSLYPRRPHRRKASADSDSRRPHCINYSTPGPFSGIIASFLGR